MDSRFDNILAWFSVSILVLIIALIVAMWFAYRVKKFMKLMAELTELKSKQINDIIKEKLSPRIHIHDSQLAVAEGAAEVIKEVAEKTVGTDSFIDFYGAASLASTVSNVESESGAKSVSPSSVYRNAVNDATDKKVPMFRYVNLFQKKDLEIRSDEVKLQYFNWLVNQVRLLRKYEGYQLIDVVRAPQWGTNMARIITKTTVMEITGNGKAAIVITDIPIAKRIRKYAGEAIAVKNAKNKGVAYGISGNTPVAEFEAYVEGIKTVCPKMALNTSTGLYATRRD